MADLVNERLVKWSRGEREQLWQDVLKRARKPVVQEPKKEVSDRNRLEERVLAALRLGDVRKALQMLNSAPIAAKTPETLERMAEAAPNRP
jgi:hypothetical protein